MVLSACVKELPFPDKPIKKGIVLNALLIGGETPKIHVYESFAPGEGNKPTELSQSIVELFDSANNLVELLSFDTQEGVFTGNTEIILGQKYTVKVREPQLGYNCSASDRVPLRKPGVIADTATIFFQGKPSFFQLDLIISDDPAEKNYYLFYVMHTYMEYKIENNQVLDSFLITEKEQVFTNDFWFVRNVNRQYSQKELLLDDLGFAGQVAFSKLGVYKLNDAKRRTKKIVLYSHAISPLHYLYTASLNEQLFYQTDPFSQSGTVFSNVKGGFGVLACSVQDSVVYLFD